MEISLEKYEAMQDRIAKLESENMFRVKQVRHLLDYIVERDELIYALRAKQPHWIKAKDRHPDDDRDVLAVINGKVLIANYLDGESVMVANYLDGWVRYVEDECGDMEPTGIDVSYWMELPEPPEEAKDADD